MAPLNGMTPATPVPTASASDCTRPVSSVSAPLPTTFIPSAIPAAHVEARFATYLSEGILVFDPDVPTVPAAAAPSAVAPAVAPAVTPANTPPNSPASSPTASSSSGLTPLQWGMISTFVLLPLLILTVYCCCCCKTRRKKERSSRRAVRAGRGHDHSRRGRTAYGGDFTLIARPAATYARGHRR